MSTETDVTIKDLLEAGVHFGHKSAVWNPKMSKYIFIKRKGVHIIDLQKTSLLFDRAYNYVKNMVANGNKVLFVGTKKQAKELIRTKVGETDHFYMTHRWVGGLLTNFDVVRRSIDQLRHFNEVLEDEEKQKKYIKKELFKMKKKRDHLNQTFEGVLKMDKPPGLIFVVDTFNEKNCVDEASLIGIPICGMVDTNSDPDNIDVVIPSNDDAIRSISLFVSKAVEAIREGEQIYQSNQDEISLFEEQLKEESEAGAEKPDSRKSGLAGMVAEKAGSKPEPSPKPVPDEDVKNKAGIEEK